MRRGGNKRSNDNLSRSCIPSHKRCHYSGITTVSTLVPDARTEPLYSSPTPGFHLQNNRLGKKAKYKYFLFHKQVSSFWRNRVCIWAFSDKTLHFLLLLIKSVKILLRIILGTINMSFSLPMAAKDGLQISITGDPCSSVLWASSHQCRYLDNYKFLVEKSLPLTTLLRSPTYV